MNSVHHIGITVSDLEESIDFYYRILGLEFAKAPTDVFGGEELSRGVGILGASLRLVMFKAGSTLIELIEYSAPESPVNEPLPSNAYGASHIAFEVNDIESEKRRLEREGVHFLSDINVVDEGPLAGWKWVYFLDPDGISHELVEISYENEDEIKKSIEQYKKNSGWV